MYILYMSVILLGAITGLCIEKISYYLIKKRSNDFKSNIFFGNKYKSLTWAVINSLIWFFIIYIGELNFKTTEIILITSACLVLSTVDISIKKIPNEVLAFIILTSIIFIILNGQINSVKLRLAGFLIGFIMFLLPVFIGKGAGLGDVKYAAVVGFCLGVYNFLASIIIMAALLIAYTVYLYISGKGNLKTSLALGPFMAFGFVSVLILSVISNKYMFFELGNFLK